MYVLQEMSQIDDINGLILESYYIPEELLIQILSYVDYKQLILCHLVCKQWNNVIKKNIWRKKAEKSCGQVFTIDNIPWNSYYSICHKKPFNRNFLTSKHLKVSYDNEDDFKIIEMNATDNNPSIYISPLPGDLLFKDNISCINIVQNSNVSERRKCVIDLIKEGFTDHILDNIQPTIEICEWYGTVQGEEKAEYECSIKLLYDSDMENSNCRVIKVYHFDKKLNNPAKRGKWFKFTHVFKNYGPGLRVLKFYHGGHNNICMTGASVVMSMPLKKRVLSSNLN